MLPEEHVVGQDVQSPNSETSQSNVHCTSHDLDAGGRTGAKHLQKMEKGDLSIIKRIFN